SNAIYLEDSGAVVEGLKFYGSPWTNSCHMVSFTPPGFSCRGDKLKEMWAKIPAGVDILLTHMPPYKMLDLAYAHWGSWDLMDRVEELAPKVHIFGHVHNSHGTRRNGRTVFINAAQDLHVQPIFFDVWI
ncbi:unnamed protein product, partial [Discosporangium mesarthrocarpum]